MRLLSLVLIVVSLVGLVGCSSFKGKSGNAPEGFSTTPASPAPASKRVSQPGLTVQSESISTDPQSPNAPAPTVEPQLRMIIRNAELSLEVDAPSEAMRRVTQIAEAQKGFVVTSESREVRSSQTQSSQIVTMVFRVPSATFADTLEKVRQVGQRVLQEKVTGQDVTEEFLDLEARIRTKKALEAQFLEIMKTARTVSDALEVQRQLAEVRTQIEQLEGRRRYLENQSAMSTFTVTLNEPSPIVTTSPTGFLQEVKQTIADSIDLAANIVLGIIRLVILLIPISILIFLPLGLLVRWLIRRFFRSRKGAAEAVKTE